MLDYCINLLEEVRDFSWSSAKASHAVLLCCMEHGEIGSWLDTDKIDRVRRAHSQRQLLSSNHTMLQLHQRKVKPVVRVFLVYTLIRTLSKGHGFLQ